MRPTLLPILFTTNEARLVNSINTNLKNLDLEYQISLDEIKALNTLSSKNQLNQLGVNNTNNDADLNNPSITSKMEFDLVTSFSLQLIELFLLDILQFTDFQLRHFDWYITLSTLVVFLAYFIPSLILNTWMLTNNTNTFTIYISSLSIVETIDAHLPPGINLKHSIQGVFNYITALTFWCLFVSILYYTTITKEVNGNFLQISLYLLSLFGVSCLSILNGIGCITGCFDSWAWYIGNEELNLKQRELELNYELRNLDALLSKSNEVNPNLNEMIMDQLIKIDSVIRDVILRRDNSHGIYMVVKFTFWLYCVYKVLYGIIRAIALVFSTVDLIQNHSNESKDSFSGNGDFLSNMIAKIILFYIYSDKKTRLMLTFDEIVENNENFLDRITMIVNFLISFSFFIFSFQNVLLTFKNFKTLSRKLVGLTKFEGFEKIKDNFIKLTQDSKSTKFINRAGNLFKYNIFTELTHLFVAETTGIYVVSTALLLNSVDMPIHLAKLMMNERLWGLEKSSTTLTSEINAEFMNNWFDRWFAVGCIGTVLVIAILDQVQTLYFTEYSTSSNYDEENIV